MNSKLQQLQNLIKERLDNLGAQIPVFSRNQSEVESSIDEVIQSGDGLCVVIMHPLPTKVQPHIRGPLFESVSVKVRVIENVYSNTSGSTLLEVAEQISERLHLWEIPLEANVTALSLLPYHPWKLLSKEVDRLRNVLEIELYTSVNKS